MLQRMLILASVFYFAGLATAQVAAEPSEPQNVDGAIESETASEEKRGERAVLTTDAGASGSADTPEDASQGAASPTEVPLDPAAIKAMERRKEEAKTAESLANTREALKQWMENERVIARRQREWKESKAFLEERIELVKREIAATREDIDKAKTAISEFDQKAAELIEENGKLKAASAELADRIATLEARSLKLLQRLPDPIRDEVKSLSQQIPEDPEGTKLALSTRFEKVIGILNHINKFNRDIKTFSEVRQLSDGRSAQVTAIYVGISQGYYVSADGQHAGVGMATAEGWEWTPNNAAADPIAQTIAVLRNEQPASFIQLPTEIK